MNDENEIMTNWIYNNDDDTEIACINALVKHIDEMNYFIRHWSISDGTNIAQLIQDRDILRLRLNFRYITGSDAVRLYMEMNDLVKYKREW